jgi:hypothetical protein
MILVILLIAAALRLPGLNTELWFDEICSIHYVQSLQNAWQVLWSIHSDNKHHLIWLWIWLMGANRADWMYRVPSFIAGIAVLPVLYQVVRREFDARTATLVLLLGSFCYPLIFYSSEARGYSPAVFFAVVAYALEPGHRRPDSKSRAVLFGVAVVLGFLSHLTFIYTYAGLLLWAAIDCMQKPRWILLLYHLPPLLILAPIYFFDVSKLQYGGGPPTTAIDVLRWTTAMTFGTPTDGILPWMIAALVLLCSAIGLRTIARRYGRARIVFFAVSILLAPAALTITRHNPYLAVRYYLVCIPFVLMLTSIGLGSVYRLLPAKIVTLVLLAAVIVNGILSTRQLQLLGRGHVRDCLQHMTDATPTDPVTVGTERPAMDAFNIDYYSRAIQPPRHFEVNDAQPPQWWILDLDSPFQVGPPTIHRREAAYKLDSLYPSDSVSGLTWDLYRRVNQ